MRVWAQGFCGDIDNQSRPFCGAAEALGLVSYGQSPFDKVVTSLVVSLVAPDVHAWKSCLSGDSAKGGGSAALDLPWARVFKGAKLVKACNSFAPGTDVLMADGTTKPIEGSSQMRVDWEL
ncbi:hypothetical protein [Streptomyces sp. NL15-2K]|uniref:hypothetical protein n=1 Tax=Streptomyces sp. NL15-2K TaxID=376149 RepID=UPI000F570F5B|nr:MULTISPECIES: hypothetical protein [Actinomycetes]WKX11791.1 hypothetical protein Q4V64_31505 [Kutzneria buriramensis]GCB46721.1 hypothetical protein SNL152K_4019 [Streptomyces sp. NL15-2K]